MKRFIALCIFAIGMLVMWPPGNQVKATNSDQVSFVSPQYVAPMALAIDNYIVRIDNAITQTTLICREGGGVEVQVFDLVTQPTYLIKSEMKRQNSNRLQHSVFRPCISDTMLKSTNSIQENNILIHRLARDGLMCRVSA